MRRRTFLAACGAASLSTACARFPYVTGRLEAGSIVVPRRELDGLDGVLVEHPSLDFPLYVHRASGDEYTAVLTRCMHRGCTVEPTDGRLICPCHGSQYTSAGAVLKGPTQRPLIRFPVRADAEHLYILETDRSPR